MLKNLPVPQLFKDLRTYNKEKFFKDLTAGIIVGIVALPLAIAFGIASGVSPTEGLITAIIGGFIVSFLGGSKVQIGGPTGAFIVIVYGIIAQHGIDGLAISTLMAGLMLLFIGFLRLGTVIRFIPYPIIVGFTSGIAVTIFTTQVKDILGLSITDIPGDFMGKWESYFAHLDTWQPLSMIFAVVTVLIIVITPKFSKKIPGSLVALILLTVVSFLMGKYTTVETPDTIGDHFTFTSALPEFRLPELSIARLQALLPSAFTIAMLGAIESLLSASVADGVIGAKHDSNTELIGQGVANIVVPFFCGIPVTGAIARTMTNINNGGRTPIAGIVHTVVLLLILLFLSPLTAYIPLAALAGVLVIVSYNMSGWRSFVAFFKGSKSDLAVLLVTFILTVLIDLTVAIEIGMLLAILLFMRRVMQVTNISKYDNEFDPSGGAETRSRESLALPEGVEIYEIDGPFFFGIANKFDETMRAIATKPYCRIIRMRKVPFIDSTGLYNLSMMADHHKGEGIVMILSGVRDEVRQTIEASGLLPKLERENICSDIFEALERAKELQKT
ncbi:SulP family inorganic anion transporter [Porphyromonas sp.]|uniref:SulP family inorganic anion transporter n=1 Tax=Porphyromonas sp. TaxID=1924944 RepID=UPI0026DD9E99|nr:SulP family inorganic anion transporter [Porphyromonas sp.]MDO4771631.1 SulP family inorganic anion transporter [Porphyromonas sp.]